MLKALLIDLDGVLRIWHTDNDERAEQATGLPKGAILEAAFADPLLSLVITGHITDEQWRQRVAATLRKAHLGTEVDRAVELWSASPGAVHHETLRLLRSCRHAARVVLVTNATSRLPKDLGRLGLQGEFDHVVNSSEVGYIKPQAEIYEAALRTAGVAPDEAFFVDDSAKNVVAARALGIEGHVFNSPEGLKQALLSVGLLQDV